MIDPIDLKPGDVVVFHFKNESRKLTVSSVHHDDNPGYSWRGYVAWKGSRRATYFDEFVWACAELAKPDLPRRLELCAEQFILNSSGDYIHGADTWSATPEAILYDAKKIVEQLTEAGVK